MLLSAGAASLILLLCYSTTAVPAPHVNPHTRGSLRPWAASFPSHCGQCQWQGIGPLVCTFLSMHLKALQQHQIKVGQICILTSLWGCTQSIRCSIVSVRTCVLSQGTERKNNYRNSVNKTTEVTIIIGYLSFPVHHR